ncbi:MAG: DMT family transporter [Alphaproteobacteria bacterium]|nr:DMT family transporter [Alphaproteobacteria bacterium]
MTPARATLAGVGAILLWSALAPLTAATSGIPPFQVLALSFGIAFVLALALWRARGESPLAQLRVPARAWLLGLYGLFGYHALYFAALKTAPPVEANLINYLWPLLIVLLAGLLPGERLRPRHVLGAAAGLAGTAVLLGDGVAFGAEHLLGYGLALGCALVWSSYSVLSRRLIAVPSSAIGGFCGGTALLAWPAHWAFESWVAPTAGQWLILIALGAGPVGAAFYLWDVGMKRGAIQLLGTLAYAAPLISTVLLIATGQGTADWRVALAGLLIVGGGFVAGRSKA